MPRSIPLPDGKMPEPPSTRDPHRGNKHQYLDISVVTACFGGGVEAASDSGPSQIDPVTPIRGGSVRGHLRFWWRATRGSQFESAEELYAAESQIWGDTDQPSRVNITVRIEEEGQSVDAEAVASKALAPKVEPLGYALFPFREEKKRDRARGRVNTKFRLDLSYPEALAPDVEAALWGWLTFGGIGSRTRRGAGSLWSSRILPQSPSPKTARKWLTKEFQKHVAAPGVSRPWPTLAPLVLLGKKESQDADKIWMQSLAVFKEFRQGAYARISKLTGKGDPFGKSRWPEADQIRDIVRAGETDVGAFPRAEFGLPIVFHFKDEEDLNSILYPSVGESEHDGSRMASPLIVKPLGVGGKNYLPMIARLNVSAPETAILTTLDKRTTEVFVQDPAPHSGKNSPLSRLSETGSAVEAFWKFAQDPKRHKLDVEFEELSLKEQPHE